MAFTSADMMFNPEIDSLELISLYVKNYKTLKDIHINLNPKFTTEYDDNGVLQIVNRNHYTRKEKNTNIKLLCGINGVGKSSILELIAKPNTSDGNILVMKTASDKFVSNTEVRISYNDNVYICNIFDREFKFGELYLPDSELHEEGLSFERYFCDLYHKEKDLFNDIDKELLTNFEITHWKRDDDITYITDAIRSKLPISHITTFDFEQLRDQDLLSYLFYKHFGDSTFEDWVGEHTESLKTILGDLDRFNVSGILIRIRKLFYNPPSDDRIYAVLERLEALLGKEYLFSDYEQIINEFINVSLEYDKIMKQVYFDNRVHQNGNDITSLFYVRGYKKIENNKRYLGNLSHGEYISVRNRYKMYVKMFQRDSSTILEDEPDIHLHPEWCRAFVNNLVETISIVRKYLANRKSKKFKDKIYNLVLTTHSPIILSDFFNEEIVFLQKENDITLINEYTRDCFAGNISEILIDNFFMTKTIGEYAEKTITKIIRKMDDAQKQKQISVEEKENINYIISRVGDRLLKKLLEEKFARTFNADN